MITHLSHPVAGDMETAPYHKEFMRQLEPLVAPGSNAWSAFREVDIMPKG